MKNLQKLLAPTETPIIVVAIAGVLSLVRGDPVGASVALATILIPYIMALKKGQGSRN